MLHLEIVIQYLAFKGNPKENLGRNEIISLKSLMNIVLRYGVIERSLEKILVEIKLKLDHQ